MLSGADDSFLKESSLSKFKNYTRVEKHSKNKKYCQGYKETMNYPHDIRLTQDDSRYILHIAASVLHLGNIKFKQNGTTEEGKDEQV